MQDIAETHFFITHGSKIGRFFIYATIFDVLYFLHECSPKTNPPNFLFVFYLADNKKHCTKIKLDVYFVHSEV